MSNLDQQTNLSLKNLEINDVLSINDDEINHLIKFHPFFSKADLESYKLIYLHNQTDSLYQVGMYY